MTSIKRVNQLNLKEAKEEFLKCCHSEKWAKELAARRPFDSVEEFLAAAEEIWFSNTTEADRLEAFKAHPKIGDVDSLRRKYLATKTISALEQKGVDGADQKTLEELASLNHKYEKKFGFIFIVFATGKTAEQMLELLKNRIDNTREEELKNASVEQNKITRQRLEKLL